MSSLKSHLTAPGAGEEYATPPIGRLDPPTTAPAWMQIDQLFQQHGLEPPPYRLRDKLVMLFCWGHYGQSAVATQADPHKSRAEDSPPVDREA